VREAQVHRLIVEDEEGVVGWLERLVQIQAYRARFIRGSDLRARRSSIVELSVRSNERFMSRSMPRTTSQAASTLNNTKPSEIDGVITPRWIWLQIASAPGDHRIHCRASTADNTRFHLSPRTPGGRSMNESGSTRSMAAAPSEPAFA